MSGIIGSVLREAMQSVNLPRLLAYGGMDLQAPADQNPGRLGEIFRGSPPDHLETVIITVAQHLFTIVDSPCRLDEVYLSRPLSDELIDVLRSWLNAQG
jgi:hypothetical protein